MSKWIPITERHPDEGQAVVAKFVYDAKCVFEIDGEYYTCQVTDNNGKKHPITHWRPYTNADQLKEFIEKYGNRKIAGLLAEAIRSSIGGMKDTEKIWLDWLESEVKRS